MRRRVVSKNNYAALGVCHRRVTFADGRPPSRDRLCVRFAVADHWPIVFRTGPGLSTVIAIDQICRHRVGEIHDSLSQILVKLRHAFSQISKNSNCRLQLSENQLALV